MNILYIITQADGGGAQTYTLSLAKHFNGAIAAGTEANGLFQAAKNLQLTTYPLTHLKRNISPYHDLMAIFEIRRLIRELRPDIVHLNSTKAGFVGSLSCISFLNGRSNMIHPKIVFTAHGFRHLEPLSPLSRWFYYHLEKLASRHRDYIIAVSDADRKSAIDGNVIDANKISTIYNGLPPLKFLARDEARSQLKLPQSVIVLGNTSNFYKTKGQDILIEAVSKLPKEILDKIIVTIFGDGPQFANSKLKIENLKLKNTFRLFGQTKNAFQYLKALDVFVMPSRKEGFPYAILEALQAGLSIIATKVGGIPEAVGDAGLFVPTQRPDELARAIISLVQDSHLRESLSRNSLLRSQLFSEQKMLSETEKIYQSLE